MYAQKESFENEDLNPKQRNWEGQVNPQATKCSFYSCIDELSLIVTSSVFLDTETTDCTVCSGLRSCYHHFCLFVVDVENARIQEDPASAHLPHLQHNAAQFCRLDGHFTDVLL